MWTTFTRLTVYLFLASSAGISLSLHLGFLCNGIQFDREENENGRGKKIFYFPCTQKKKTRFLNRFIELNESYYP